MKNVLVTQQCVGLNTRNKRCTGRAEPGERLCRKCIKKFVPAHRWAISLPDMLSKLFQESYESPEVYSLRKELALIEAREVELTLELAKAEEIKDKRQRDGTKARIWGEQYKVFSLKAKLADSHTKRMNAVGAFFSAQEVRMLIAQIVQFIQDAPITPEVRQELFDKINALLQNRRRTMEGEEGRESRDLEATDAAGVPVDVTPGAPGNPRETPETEDDDRGYENDSE